MHVRGVERLSTLVRLVGDESIARRSGRDLVLTRLAEVLLIEALRSTQGDDTPPGLLRGLADARIAPAMQQMHGQISKSWTMAQLAKKGGAVSVCVLRSVYAHGRDSADGIFAGVADGRGEGFSAAAGGRDCRGCRARWVWAGEYV